MGAASIRLGRAEDIEAVRLLLQRTWHATYDASMGAQKVAELSGRWHAPERLRAELARPGTCFLVAEADGRTTGHAFATLDPDGATVMLHRLYVDPAAQRAGLGSALLERVIAAFPAARVMRLEVEAVNRHAIGFYRRHGFAEAGLTPSCGRDSDVPAVLMRRDLAG